ncbi:MAG: HAMP domain-containing sensor histidine kinase, partial [Bacteroidetes bacterium]|nr:HAMP domain-containing sensor histidine kinase [Bacteroidota bacterium]
KLEHQNKELRKANSELDRFVYSASHDLRAPLKSMLGLIAITQENNAPNTEQFLQLEMLNKSVVKLDNFIEDILHYSRNSRTEIVKEEIEFAEMIDEIRASHHFMDGSNDLQMSVEIRNHEKFVSDNRRVNVILNNLISNAIKYQDKTKNGKSFVRIDVDCFGDKAIIIVEDNGIGIAENDKDKVFEMFYRATKLSSGSGLGLYIIKETVEKLNGKITMETELSKGTKLTIEIPNQKK